MRVYEHPKFLRRTWALSRGFFWLPCPNCGKEFGGNEWMSWDGHKSSIPIPNSTREKGICPWCTIDGVGDRAWKQQVSSDFPGLNDFYEQSKGLSEQPKWRMEDE